VPVFSSQSSFSTFPGGVFRVVHAVNRQPSWVIRATVGAGLLVLLGVLAVILVPVIAVMAAVFAVGSGLARVRRWFSPLRSSREVVILEFGRRRDAGRRNVRVIGRDQ
jgi:hypothetical protein